MNGIHSPPLCLLSFSLPYVCEVSLHLAYGAVHSHCQRVIHASCLLNQIKRCTEREVSWNNSNWSFKKKVKAIQLLKQQQNKLINLYKLDPIYWPFIKSHFPRSLPTHPFLSPFPGFPRPSCVTLGWPSLDLGDEVVGSLAGVYLGEPILTPE